VSTIGIKVADGSFHPILERDSSRWKKLVLTTVRDGQTSVQIDLYEGENITIESAKYVGSLLIEDIAPAAAGEAEIKLEIGMEKNGRRAAKAEDLNSGDSQSLNVSLESLGEEGIYDIPEFELGDELDSFTDTGGDLSDEEPSGETGGFTEEVTEEYAAPRRRRPILLAFFIILGVAAVAALSIFLFKLFEGPDVPPLEALKQVPALTAAADTSGGGAETAVAGTETGAEEPVGVSPAETDTAAAARDGPETTASSGVPPSAPEESAGGVWYSVRRGDTLWDISWNFYRNPWQYGKIAKENSIRNPDRILAGTRLFIPEKE